MRELGERLNCVCKPKCGMACMRVRVRVRACACACALGPVVDGSGRAASTPWATCASLHLRPLLHLPVTDISSCRSVGQHLLHKRTAPVPFVFHNNLASKSEIFLPCRSRGAEHRQLLPQRHRLLLCRRIRGQLHGQVGAGILGCLGFLFRVQRGGLKDPGINMGASEGMARFPGAGHQACCSALGGGACLLDMRRIVEIHIDARLPDRLASTASPCRLTCRAVESLSAYWHSFALVPPIYLAMFLIRQVGGARLGRAERHPASGSTCPAKLP